MARGIGPGRPPVVLVTFIVAAIGFGAAAVLLAAPAAPPPNSSSSGHGGVTLNEVSILAEVLLIALIVVPLVIFLINHSRGGASPIPSRPIAFALIVLLLLTGFVFFAHYVQSGGTHGSGTVPPANNSTGSTPPDGNISLNVTNGTILPGLAIPNWAIYALVVGVGVVVALLVVPMLVARSEAKPRGNRRRDELRADLAAAIAELSEGPVGTPRERIIQVYARWLGRIVRGSGDLATLTPREIESLCVGQLGITMETAHELTSLFEEARYSRHPIEESDVGRAQQALVRALAEFDRARPAPPSPTT